MQLDMHMECLWRQIWSLIDEKLPFENRKSYFLKILKKLLDDDVVKMGRRGVIIEGESEELINRIEKAWPQESNFDDDMFSTVIPYRNEGEDLLRTHYWIIGDLVWINPQGGTTWSTNAEIQL